MKYKVKEIKLKSGASGLLIDVPDVKIMRFNLSFMAGTLLCPPDKPDLAHMLEHMVLKANEQHREEKDLIIDICRNGASINAYTDGNSVGYEASCADFEWQRVFKLLTFAVSKPLLLDEHFATEIKVVKEEMTRHLDNYPRIVSTSIIKAAGGMDLTPQTRVDNLTNLNPADLRTFYKRTHFAANMRFVIAGNLTGREKEIRAILEGLDFDGGQQRFLRRQTPAELVAEPIALDYQSVGKLYFEFRATHSEKRRLSLRELTSLGILHELLIGSGGTSLASRINGQARERGLTYGVHCGWTSLSNASFFLAGNMDRENAAELFDLITVEIRKILNGQLTTAEIREMKQRFLGFQHSRELTTAALANYYEHYTILNADEEYHDYDADIKLLPSIKKDDLVEALAGVLSGNWYLGLLGADSTGISDDLHRRIAVVAGGNGSC